MCGRFTLTQSPSIYADYFGVEAVKTEALASNYNVAPTDPVYAVATRESERQLGVFRWGLIPWYAKDRKVAARHINARVETVATKASFKDSFVRKRCIVPADGFFEWEPKQGKGKLPHYIHQDGGAPIGFAGLWASWKDPESGDRVRTCTILTGDPDPVVKPIHDRMPVMLAPEVWDTWLDPANEDAEDLLELLRTRPAVTLAEYAVSTLVNNVRNNVPEIIEPLGRSG
jgi:putative SOS response-associated peptidase YedK